MRNVFVAADNVYTPIGSTTDENFNNIQHNISGVKEHAAGAISSQPFFASLFKENHFNNGAQYTKFEQMIIASVSDALKNLPIDVSGSNTILIVSSTKGNIGLLVNNKNDESLQNRVSLHYSAKLLANYFKLKNTPVVISNACISGVLAIVTGKRMIQTGQYDHAIVTGADSISKFILSGFQSFQAVSNEACKPFDAERNGISLGEGAGTVILTANEKLSTGIKIMGGATSNDANHISGPSRTGEELSIAVSKAMKQANLSSKDIHLISAHGTATLYNDEMEALALTLADLNEVPVNSLKGFYGHTLGAAGMIESIMLMQSLKHNIAIPTKGFLSHGVSVPLNVIKKLTTGNFTNALKTASGFGGCNAAMVISQQ